MILGLQEQAEPAAPWEVWAGLGIGVALHALTWANLFSGIHPTTSDFLVGAVRALYPGLAQWIFLLPAAVVARLRHRDNVARGIIWVGIASLILNVTAAFLLSARV
jgi:hypothetical protein